MPLRDYQIECRDAALEKLDAHGSTLIVLPTGTGKTIVFAELANHFWNDLGLRTMVVAPQNVLVDQAAEKIRARTGWSPAIERAQQRSNEADWAKNPFVVASAQTLTMRNKKTGKRRFERFTDIGLLVIDEAHLRLQPPTIEMVNHFKSHGAKVLAVTATPKRLDGVAMQNIVESVAYQMSLLEGIERGWLVQPQTRIVQINSLDLKDVRTHGKKGDFVEAELQKVLEEERVTYEIAGVVAAECGKLKTAVFCASVLQAKKVAELLADVYGLNAAWICSDKRLCSDEHREGIMYSFTEVADGVQIVCNVGILTTGWDYPGLEHIVMARPTKSAGLYEQIMGRGTRTLAGTVDFDDSTPELRLAAIAASAKPHFKMTDLVDNSLRHKLVTSMDVLSGREPKEVVEKAKDIAVDESTGRTYSELIEEARKKLEEEERERRRLEEEANRKAEDALRERLARYKGEVDYKTHTVDPFDPMQRGMGKRNGQRTNIVMPWGKYKGTSLSDLKSRTLEFYLEKDGDKEFWTLKPYLRQAIEIELSNRVPDPATPAQIGGMKNRGIAIPEGCTKSQASKLIGDWEGARKPKPPEPRKPELTTAYHDDSEAPWEGINTFNPEIGF